MSDTPANALQPVGFSRLRGLDGLRAISIVAVLLGHAAESIPLPAAFKTAVLPYAANAALGVRVFFVLSGFLITHLLRRELTRDASINLPGFYARRALRIFPALYAYLLTILILSYAGALHTTGGDIARAGTFLTNYGFLLRPNTNDDYWFVGHFWTLSLEEQFYLLWPLTLAVVGLRTGPWVAGAIVALTPLVRTASYFVFPSTREHLGMMLHTAADPIMMGCLAALITDRPVIRRALASPRAGVWAATAAVFLVLPSTWLEQKVRGGYVATVGTTLTSALIAGIIMHLISRPESRAVRWLETPPLRVLGVLSYSLYLWQQLFLGGAKWAWAPFPVNLLACFAAATLSSLLIERPFLKLRGRFAPRARAPATSLTSPAPAASS